jgi:hypothetical protein
LKPAQSITIPSAVTNTAARSLPLKPSVKPYEVQVPYYIRPSKRGSA